MNKPSQANRLRAALTTALAEIYRRQQKLAQAEQEQSIAAKLEDEKITKEWDIWGPTNRLAALENFPIDLQVQLRSRAAEQRMIL